MPRNSSGVYTKPGSTTAVSGSPISSSAYNNLADDIASELTASLPTNGTTGMTAPLKLPDGTAGAPAVTFTSATTRGFHKTTNGIGIDVGGALVAEATSAGLLNASGAAYAVAPTIAWTDIASATTTDIGAVDSTNLRVTGTTAITGLGTVATGTTRNLRFAGILTFTYNGTSLILPGAASITTAANDTCTAVSLGSGNWIIVDYHRASGLPIVNPTVAAVTSVTAGSGLSGGAITTSGTIAIDTNNSFGIGSYALLQNVSAGSIAAAATASGAALANTYFNGSTYTTIGAVGGTWRNMTGTTLGNGTGGLWMRTA